MSKQLIKPYGDTKGDGRIQLSFTLPVENSPKAVKAAEVYLQGLNLENIAVCHSKKIAEGFTYFVAYASGKHEIDYSKIQVVTAETKILNFYEINDLIVEKLNKKITVVGATIGDDAHTVGIDAIMNMKGYNMDYGLERYPQMEAYNLGAQLPPEELLKHALEKKADAILVSQTVTQKKSHIHNFSAFINLVDAEGLRDNFVIIAGGPRVSHELAIELGYDGGFGAGTLPSQVASFIVTTLCKKLGKEI